MAERRTARPPDEAPSAARRRLSRAERAVEAREQLFAAAAQVVGLHGYTDASIARITEAAGMAQGTFYLHFQSRQDLFDQLLPHVGASMLDYIRTRIHGVADVFEMEERGLRAFFDFLGENPGFFRILNEAEVASPTAHRKHFELLTRHYVDSLQRAIEAGEITRYGKEELETLAYIFMAARSYLYLRYVKDQGTPRMLPETVIETYMKLLRGGLRSAPLEPGDDHHAARPERLGHTAQ
jgi:AcrR family transcriptional regulator